MDQDYINYPQAPWYEDRHNWLLIGGGLLLAILIVVGAMWFVRSREASRAEAVRQQELVETTKAELDAQLSVCEASPDSDLCRSELTRRAALRSGAANVCDSLTGEALTACVRDVAGSRGDEDLCKILTEGDLATCTDWVRFLKAKNAQSYEGCASIQDATLLATCQQQLQAVALNDHSCQELGIAESICTARAIEEEAILTSDPSLCDRLPPEDQENCFEIVKGSDQDEDGVSLQIELGLGTDPAKADTDGDGLLDGDEVLRGTDPLSADPDGDGLPDGEEVLIWGTDPFSKDTDGDGFSDGEEVKNEYNPLGEGMMVQ